MKPENGSETKSQDIVQARPQPRIPNLRTFKVRKYNAAGEMVETIIQAHYIEYAERGMVSFADAEVNHNGEVALRVHNVVFHVEEIEEAIRVPNGSPIITH